MAFNAQMHYIILAENNQICYVPEDQLSICPSKEIDNIEIGKYFSYFEGNFYVPNENLKEHYPEDIAALTGLLIKQ
ncbi:F-box only protein 21-like [Cataglyphis hispanica]|uniref:F-box only protein 21-like n=1 Tax=Cataglyphis hispanica TaxID=1086592 RepID=UPI00218030B2|nr:F-box only protein 21-like [Cataglyphis hispanica]